MLPQIRFLAKLRLSSVQGLLAEGAGRVAYVAIQTRPVYASKSTERLTSRWLQRTMIEVIIGLINFNNRTVSTSHAFQHTIEVQAMKREELIGRYEAGERDFKEAFLGGVNLRGIDLSGIKLGGANLRCANLREANLSRADLGGADLYEADLRETLLRNADLSNTILWRAELLDADLTGANLKGAKVAISQLQRTASLSGVTMPDSSRSE